MREFTEKNIKTARAIAQDHKFEFIIDKKPFIQKIVENNNIAQFRGYTDSSALEHSLSDHQIKLKYLPKNLIPQKIYQEIETIRCEILGAQKYPGIAQNITAKYIEQIKQALQREIKEPEQSLAQKITINIALELMQKIYDGKNEPIINKFCQQQKLPKNINIKQISNEMFDNLSDQEKFAQIIHKTIQKLNLINNQIPEEQQKNNQKKQQQDNKQKEQKNAKSSCETQKTQESENKSQPSKTQQKQNDKIKNIHSKNFSPYKDCLKKDEKYTIYTTQFDQEIEANKLAEKQELKNLRKQLDLNMQDMKKIVLGLANKLQRKLMSRKTTQWQFNSEEGIIDNARLANIVIAAKKNQMQNLSYKKETDEKRRETIVTLLLDNSGSMRGRPIINAAMCADIIAQTLEKCRVRVEILGFTTTKWKGGKAREKWLENKSPDKPGRLNDLRHIIYKPADLIYRRAKNNLGLVLKDGILKENIDGEALIWACSRIVKYHEKRKILIVISDGAPVDDSSIAANEPLYLDSHLRRVINFIENKSDIEITAIGIGHDVKRYYKNAIAIKDSQKLAKVLIEKISQLFEVEQNDSYPIKRRRNK